MKNNGKGNSASATSRFASLSEGKIDCKTVVFFANTSDGKRRCVHIRTKGLERVLKRRACEARAIHTRGSRLRRFAPSETTEIDCFAV